MSAGHLTAILRQESKTVLLIGSISVSKSGGDCSGIAAAAQLAARCSCKPPRHPYCKGGPPLHTYESTTAVVSAGRWLAILSQESKTVLSGWLAACCGSSDSKSGAAAQEQRAAAQLTPFHHPYTQTKAQPLSCQPGTAWQNSSRKQENLACFEKQQALLRRNLEQQ